MDMEKIINTHIPDGFKLKDHVFWFNMNKYNYLQDS